MQKRIRTPIFREALEKIAKEKSISVAEVVRRIIDRDLDRKKTKRVNH
jgi:hypothetical protein